LAPGAWGLRTPGVDPPEAPPDDAGAVVGGGGATVVLGEPLETGWVAGGLYWRVVGPGVGLVVVVGAGAVAAGPEVAGPAEVRIAFLAAAC
jgi:hypothetical protein